jgi:hypothetical protein
MKDMTKKTGIQASFAHQPQREFPGFDFFAPFKQMFTHSSSSPLIDRSTSICPSMHGGWRMRIKLPSGRYKYSYFEKGEWKSKASGR